MGKKRSGKRTKKAAHDWTCPRKVEEQQSAEQREGEKERRRKTNRARRSKKRGTRAEDISRTKYASLAAATTG
jgi:hypothetical protein